MGTAYKAVVNSETFNNWRKVMEYCGLYFKHGSTENDSLITLSMSDQSLSAWRTFLFESGMTDKPEEANAKNGPIYVPMNFSNTLTFGWYKEEDKDTTVGIIGRDAIRPPWITQLSKMSWSLLTMGDCEIIHEPESSKEEGQSA